MADALAGRDVCGKAKTGSGKTLAFGVPLLQRAKATRDAQGAPAPARPARPLALVLLPTRELAVQVHDVLAPLAQKLGPARRGRLRRRGHRPPGRQAAQGRRRRDRHPGPAHRPRRPRRGRGRRPRDAGARRGRPHGRHGLHAAGRVGAPPTGPGAPDAPLLGHPRRRRRPAGQAIPDRPRLPRGGVVHPDRHPHGAPVPPGAPDGQGQGGGGHLPGPGEVAALRPHQAGRRPTGREPRQGGGRVRRPSTATCARPTGSGRWRTSRTASCPCSSRPTSRPGASTSRASTP